MNKVVAIMSRRFNADDETVLIVWSDIRKRSAEAIIVIGEFIRLDEYFSPSENRAEAKWSCLAIPTPT